MPAHHAATGQKVSLIWGVGFHVINDIGFALVFPVGLALFSRAAPRSVAGLMLGIYYLHLFAANMLVGRIGGFLESMGDFPAGRQLLSFAATGQR